MKIINAIGFNFIWFGCIFYGNNFAPVALLLIFAHLYFVKNRYQETFFIGVITTIGFTVDSLLTCFSIFIFPNQVTTIPFWLVLIWAAFAATLNHSLSFLQQYPIAQALSGAIAAPLCYLAGHKLQAVSFGYSTNDTLLILSILWLLLIPLFFRLMRCKFGRKTYV